MAHSLRVPQRSPNALQSTSQPASPHSGPSSPRRDQSPRSRGWGGVPVDVGESDEEEEAEEEEVGVVTSSEASPVGAATPDEPVSPAAAAAASTGATLSPFPSPSGGTRSELSDDSRSIISSSTSTGGEYDDENGEEAHVQTVQVVTKAKAVVTPRRLNSAGTVATLAKRFGEQTPPHSSPVKRSPLPSPSARSPGPHPSSPAARLARTQDVPVNASPTTTLSSLGTGSRGSGEGERGSRPSTGVGEDPEVQYALASPRRGAGHPVPLIGVPRPGAPGSSAATAETSVNEPPPGLPLSALPLFRSPADVPFSPDMASPESHYTSRSMGSYSGFPPSASAVGTARTSTGFSIPNLSAMLPTPTPGGASSIEEGRELKHDEGERTAPQPGPSHSPIASSASSSPRAESPSASSSLRTESPTASASEQNLRARRLKARAAKLEAEGREVPGKLRGDLDRIETGPVQLPPPRPPKKDRVESVPPPVPPRSARGRDGAEESERRAREQQMAKEEVAAQRKQRQVEQDRLTAQRERERQQQLYESDGQTPASGEFREEVSDWTQADDADEQSGYASSDTHGLGPGAGGGGGGGGGASGLAKRSASFIRGMLPSRPSSSASGHFGVGATMQRPSSAASNHSSQSTRSNRSATFFGVPSRRESSAHRRPSIEDIRRSIVIPNDVDTVSASGPSNLGHRRDTSFEEPRRAPRPPPGSGDSSARSGELAVPSNPFERPGSASSVLSGNSVDSTSAVHLARSVNLRSNSVTPRLPPAAPPPSGPPPARPAEMSDSPTGSRRAATAPPITPVPPTTARPIQGTPSPTLAKPTPIRAAAPAPPPNLALPPIPPLGLGRFSFEGSGGLSGLSAAPSNKGGTDSAPPSRTPSRGAPSLAAPQGRLQSASSEDLRTARPASAGTGAERAAAVNRRVSSDNATQGTNRRGLLGNSNGPHPMHLDSPARSTNEPVEDLAEGSSAHRFSGSSLDAGHNNVPQSPADSIRSVGSASTSGPQSRFLSASSNAGSSSSHKGASLAPSGANGSSWDAYKHSNASASSAVSSLQIHGAEQRSSMHSSSSASGSASAAAGQAAAAGPRFSSGSAGTFGSTGTFGSSVSVSVGGRDPRASSSTTSNTNSGTPRSSLGHGTDGGRHAPPSAGASPRADLVQLRPNSSSVRSISRPASPSSPGMYSDRTGTIAGNYASGSTTTTPTPQTGPIPGSIALAPGMTLIEDDIEYEETREMPEPSSLYGIRRRLVSTFPTLGGKSNVIRPLSALRSVSRTSLAPTDDEGDPEGDAYEQWEHKRKGAVLMGEKAIRKAEEKLEAREKNLSIEALSKQEVATVAISVYTEQRDGKWVVRGPAVRGVPPQEELPHVGDPWATPIDSKGIVARKKLKSNVELTTTRTVIRCPDCTVPLQQLSSFTAGANPPAPKVPPGQHCHTCSGMKAIETVWVVTVTLRVATFQPLKLPASHLLGTRQSHLRYIEATDAEHRDAVLRDRAIDGTLTAASRVGRQHAQMHGARLLMARAKVDRRIVLSVAVTNARTKARRTFDVVDGPEGKVSETTMVVTGASANGSKSLRKSSSASSALQDYNQRAASQLELSHDSDAWRSAVSLAGTANGQQQDGSVSGRHSNKFARVGQSFGRKNSAGHYEGSSHAGTNGGAAVAGAEYLGGGGGQQRMPPPSSSEGRLYNSAGQSSASSTSLGGEKKGRLRGLFKS